MNMCPFLMPPPPAAISPADVNYMKTLNTLRFASQAKNIVNSPTVNDNGSMKVMRELQSEVTKLNQLLKEATQVLHMLTFTGVLNIL